MQCELQLNVHESTLLHPALPVPAVLHSATLHQTVQAAIMELQ